MITVTRDHLENKAVDYDLMNLQIRYGPVIEDLPTPDEGPVVKFRLLDDDGEVYYSGTLHDDPHCLNQEAALAWGKADSGCTEVQVRRDGQWVADIG